MARFQEGDVVRHKSQLTKMTVIEVLAEEEKYKCAWIAQGGRKKDTFSVHELEMPPAPPKGKKSLANSYVG